MFKSIWLSIKKAFWALVYKLYPHTRDLLLTLRILKHVIRQPYRAGFLRRDRSIEAFGAFLATKGYHANPMAWVDPGEVLNMRKLINVHYQYHIRVFPDREVKAHFECTPERHPVAHLNELAMLPAREYFHELMAGWLVDRASATVGQQAHSRRAEALNAKYPLPRIQVFQSVETREDQ